MKKIKAFLKQNRIVYYIYNYVLSFLLKVLGLFCKTDNKLILFNSYGGKRYDDSPKAIYEYMKKSNKYNNYKLIWVLDNPKLVDGQNVEYIKNNTIKFFINALKAKYWITNSSMERGLKFKKKNTIYINTWHGSTFKKLGTDMSNKNYKFRVSKDYIMYAQSNKDIEIFSKAFNKNKNDFVLCGLPRNDELCHVTKKEIDEIKKKIGISSNKKIILYAPTFREYDYDSNGCILAPPINLKKWEKELSDKYIVFFRAHYEVNKVLNIETNKFIYNMTNYQELNDLLKICDIIISDYSSIMIDYSILERPIYAYTYDYEEYKEKRGLYYDLNKILPNGIQKTEDELLEKIKKCNFTEQKEKTKKFKSQFVEKCGHASEYIDKIINKYS